MIEYFKNLFAALDNRINPIAIKEMRQAVRSRYITMLLQIYLLIELIVAGFYLLTFDARDLSTGGTDLFSFFIGLLIIANLICVPVYTSTRLTKEVRGNDAMFSSALTPMQIVRGKFYCGLIISLLLFSAATPFIIVTYLLRGLDIQDILLSLYWTFLIIQVFNCYGIAFGALNFNVVLRIFLAIVMGFALMGIIENLSFGLLSSFSSASWETILVLTIFSLFLGESFLILAGSILSPISFNRMTRPRIFATASSCALLIISFVYSYYTSNDDYIEMALVVTFVITLVFLGIGLCERMSLSSRQIQQIPGNLILRVLAFPFFSGVGSAIAWFIMMFGILLTFDCYAETWIINDFAQTSGVFPFLYMILFYSTCGLLIRLGVDKFRRDNLSQILPENPHIVIYPTPQQGFTTIVYSLILMAIPSLIPFLLLFNQPLDMGDYFCFSPLYYMTDVIGNKNMIPQIFGFFSAIILIIYCLISFVYYLESYNRKERQNRIQNTVKSC